MVAYEIAILKEPVQIWYDALKVISPGGWPTAKRRH